jgi:hypothetical protein
LNNNNEHVNQINIVENIAENNDLNEFSNALHINYEIINIMNNNQRHSNEEIVQIPCDNRNQEENIMEPMEFDYCY